MTVVGELSLWVSLLLAAWGSVAAAAGATLNRAELVLSAHRSIASAAFMAVLAAAGLLSAFVSHDFSLEYVASHSSTNTPSLYLVTALWAGAEGSLLSLAIAFATSAAFATARKSAERPTVGAWIAGTLAATLTLVLAGLCFATNPYDRVEWVPTEGRGLHPALQHPLAAIRSIAIHAGLGMAAAAAVCKAGATLTGNRDTAWMRAADRLAPLSWLVLSTGLGSDMRLAYLDSAAGSTWKWDAARLAQLGAWVFLFVWTMRLATNRRLARRMTYVACAGVAIVFVGLVASDWSTDRTVRLRPGQVVATSDPYGRRWRFVSQGASRDEQVSFLSTSVAVEAHRGDRPVGIVNAERRQYVDGAQHPTHAPIAIPGIWSAPTLDVYVVLMEVTDDDAELRLGFRPLAAAVWVGVGIVIVAGAVLALSAATPVRSPGASRT